MLSTQAKKIILCNPRSASHNHRLPLSVLQIAASVAGKYDFVIVDGNLEKDTWQKLNRYLESGEFAFFACTVMPGPQLKEAIVLTKAVKKYYPGIIVIWGGYFASIQYKVCLESGLVDYVVCGPGDYAFPKLIQCLSEGRSEQLMEIGNLVFNRNGKLVTNPRNPVSDQDTLPALPLEKLNTFYPLEKYIVETFMGDRTFSYHSSIGCPYTCGFCGVAGVYHSAWKGKSAKVMAEEILRLKDRYGINAIEFYDSNFFCSHSRTIEFCRLMQGMNITWWAEGRVDTMNQYSDEELQLIRESGCCLVFMGAETSNNSLLAVMNKGSSFRVNDTLELVKRFKSFEIIPQLSFVMGLPGDSPGKTRQQIRDDILFIRQIKKLNPRSDIVLYLYSPVPSENSTLYKTVQDAGLKFPGTLEEWMGAEWENFDLRRGATLPWIQGSMIRMIRNFEVVLTAAYPGISNFQLGWIRKGILRIFGKTRYLLHCYYFPYELKALLQLFSYQRPEKEGFYSS